MRWTIELSNGETITADAPSKVDATRQARRYLQVWNIRGRVLKIRPAVEHLRLFDPNVDPAQMTIF